MLPRLARQRLLAHPLRRRDVGVRRRRELRDPLEAVALRHGGLRPRPARELPVLVAQARGIDEQAGPVAEAILAELRPRGEADLALEVAARFPVELLARVLDLPPGDVADFARRYWAMQRGIHWEPVAEEAGRAAIAELTAYFAPLVEARRADPGDDLVSAIATLELDSGPATAEDVVVTLLEGDHETLHGSLANLWYLLLGDREQLDLVVRGAAHGEARVPGGAAALPAGAGRPPLRPSRGGALRSPPAQGRPDDLLGRRRQPGPARVPQRPRRLHRPAQGPVPARAAGPVPGRRPAHRHRLRARSALEAPCAPRGPAPVALCHLP